MKMGKEKREMQIHYPNPAMPVWIGQQHHAFLDHAQPDSPIYHEEVEIKLFTAGSATLVVNTDPVNVLPGDIVVINPYEFHSTIDIKNNDGIYDVFIVSLDFFTRTNPAGLNLREMLLAKGIRFQNLIRGNGELITLLQKISLEHHKNQDEFAPALIEAFLLEFFIRLFREFRQPESDMPSMDQKIRYYSVIDPAMRHIRTAYSSSLSIDELAERCCISKYHFCRIFKLATGQSAIQYIMQYRLRIAHAMLGDESKNIADIAAACGFSDVNYFYRCYKRKYQCSPHQRRAKSS